MIELLGYCGTALIVASLAMKSLVRLRLVNLTGSVVYIVYGVCIKSPPVILLNLLTSLLNGLHLYRISSHKEKFAILPANSIDEPMMQKFIEFYGTEINEYFGTPDLNQAKEYIALYILRDMNIAGIFIGSKIPLADGYQIDILIDFVIPTYRDFKNSLFLFHHNETWLREQKIKHFCCTTTHPRHIHYLKKVGFKKCDQPDRYILKNAVNTGPPVFRRRI